MQGLGKIPLKGLILNRFLHFRDFESALSSDMAF